MQNGDTARYPHCFQQHRKLVVESVEGKLAIVDNPKRKSNNKE